MRGGRGAGVGSISSVMGDAFDILGLPVRMDLQPDQVERAYLRRAAGAHPDAAGAGDDSASAELNAARSDLIDPETRANLVLARLGGPNKEQDRSLPEGFLAFIMERREALDECLASGDRAGRAEFEAWVRAERARYASELAAVLGDTPDEDARRGARRLLNAWRYIERFAEQLRGASDPA